MPPSRPRLLRSALAGAVLLVVGPVSMTPAAAEEPLAPGTVVGELVRAYLDPRTAEGAGGAEHAEPLIWVQPERGAAVRLTGDQADDLPVGATVEVRVGTVVVDEAAAEGDLDPARVVLGADVLEPAPDAPVAAAAAPYTNEVTVALVAPAGTVPDAVTAEQVAALVGGPVADFWERESYGAIRIGVAPLTTANDWVTTTTPCKSYAALWRETATRLGFDVDAPGKHLLLYLPEEPEALEGCGYGLGTVGTEPGSGGLSYVRDTVPSVVAHELGHNFGLEHSSMLRCPGSLETGDCYVFPYDDGYDVMGYSWGVLGSLSALNGTKIGVLPQDNRYDVRALDPTGEYTLAPIGSRTGRVGLRLIWDDLVYSLEYRTATGQDAWLADQSVLQTGVLLRQEVVDPAAEWDDSSLLLDGSPGAAWDRPADQRTVLTEDQDYWLAGGAFHVTVTSTGSTAVVRVSTLAGAPMPRDMDEDLMADLLAVDPGGVLWSYGSTSNGPFLGRERLGGGWQTRDAVLSTGDLDGDDKHDVLAREPRTGKLWFYAGDGYGRIRAGRVVSGGWNAMNALLSPGDWNGDGRVDLLARRRADGVLYLYAGTGTGAFLPGVRLGGGWGTMTALAATGDLDLDGTIDFVARRSDGMLMLYRGNGRGGFAGAPRAISRGWQQFTAISGPGDWDGDGAADLLVKKTDGSILVYWGTGTGTFAPPLRLGGGWGRYRLAV